MRPSIGPDCTADVPRNSEGELQASEPSFGGNRRRLGHGYTRIEGDRSRRLVDVVPRAAIERHDAPNASVANNHVATAPEDAQWPATCGCKSNEPTQGEAIANGDHQVGRSTDAHRGVLGERLVAQHLQAESAL